MNLRKNNSFDLISNMNLILFLLLFPILCFGNPTEDSVVLESSITNEFLQIMNPFIMKSLNQLLTQSEPIPIPPQEINIKHVKIYNLDIKNYAIRDVQWSSQSGVYFDQGALAFKTDMGCILDVNYITNSYFFHS